MLTQRTIDISTTSSLQRRSNAESP